MVESMNSNKSRIGDIVELKAQTWLLEQGYEVFRNVSGKGPIDMLAMDTEGKITRIDVKKVVDGKRKRVRVNQPRLTDKQKELDVKLLHYDEKENVFAWDISYIRQLHNQIPERPTARATPDFIKESKFKSLAALCRHYGVHPSSLRERVGRGDTIEEAVTALQQRSKKVFVNGLEFPDKKRACEYFGVAYTSLEYWIYDKGKTIETAINLLLEKKNDKNH